MSTPQTTTMFAVIDYLVTTFTNDNQLGGATPPLQVVEGNPGGDAQQEFISIGEAIAGDESWAGLGATSSDEEYTVTVYVQVETPGNERAEVQARVKAIYSRCQQLLRADPTLGLGTTSGGVGTVRNAKVSTPSYEPYALDEGFGAHISFGVRVTAYMGAT